MKETLVKQRAAVTASPEAARAFLISLGLGDLIEEFKNSAPHKTPSKKAAPKR